ncbi:DUF1292 domain-containing protein [Lactococcus garvieae]|jgi:uncharacterized protein YrzB (UPF0473 family)|uniref:UPF0473 protein C426_0860 n=1 Tax=Lactococcus garvieae DCC43 TaxID=1231377 RepID=K2PWE4_9LACT|nr:DUF1292 domain-containing protein [Lactococcus garvieae]EKF51751.1 SAR1694-like protein [Lactococcus garvieae DCC43]
MSEHTHDHEHEDRFITLIDDNGSESLFEILITIDGQEEFGKNYVLVMPVDGAEDDNGEVEIQAYSFTQNEDGTEGDLQPIPEESDAEWDMIEEVFNNFMENQDDEVY